MHMRNFGCLRALGPKPKIWLANFFGMACRSWEPLADVCFFGCSLVAYYNGGPAFGVRISH